MLNLSYLFVCLIHANLLNITMLSNLICIHVHFITTKNCYLCPIRKIVTSYNLQFWQTSVLTKYWTNSKINKEYLNWNSTEHQCTWGGVWTHIHLNMNIKWLYHRVTKRRLMLKSFSWHHVRLCNPSILIFFKIIFVGNCNLVCFKKRLVLTIFLLAKTSWL